MKLIKNLPTYDQLKTIANTSAESALKEVLLNKQNGVEIAITTEGNLFSSFIFFN